MQKKTFKDRLKNPLFLAAAAGFAYKIYSAIATAQGWPHVASTDWNLGADLVAYVAIGSGIYSTFEKKQK